MDISTANVIIRNVEFENRRMTVFLSDGREISVPIEWFPRLGKAGETELKKWEISAAGHGIHWRELDEDISIEGLLYGQPSAEMAIHTNH